MVEAPSPVSRFIMTASGRSLQLGALYLLGIAWLVAAETTVPPGAVPCQYTADATTDPDCTLQVGPGSACTPEGLCSNPFVSGCLRAMLGTEAPPNDNTHQKIDPRATLRTCNSQDPEDAVCLPSSPLEYMEIRILTGNWESSLVTAWAMQILLSEWMQVPTSIESSSVDKSANFYHPTNQLDYGAVAYDYDALETAHEMGDCRGRYNLETPEEDGIVFGSLTNTAPIDETNLTEAWFANTYNTTNATDILEGEAADAPQNEKQEDPYRSCAHIMPEVWNGQAENLWSLTQRRIIEAPEGNGVIGKLTWFLPKFVAEQHPEWGHYSGWTRNRTQVATSFHRPLTWGEYCRNISGTLCTQPDAIAARPPHNLAEADRYYCEEESGNGIAYTGHFHATEQNDCSAQPENCTGHFTDFPCDWGSFAVPQAYHLGIAVASNGKIGPNHGYSYAEKLDIWSAANATQSNVMMNWYSPDPTYQWYRGTSSEFQEVQLPPPSPDCVANRVSVKERCSDDPLVRAGDPVGACGAEVQTLEKVVVQNLYHTIYKSRTKDNSDQIRGSGQQDTFGGGRDEVEALRSPAYEAVKNFHISEFDIGKIFEDWRDRFRDRNLTGYSTWSGNGADPRYAVCQWVAENAEHLQTFIPNTYPRMLQEDDPYDTLIFKLVMAFAVFVTSCIIVVGILTFVLRDKPAFRTAQLPFLYMILFGLLTISIGAIFFSLEPRSGTCVARSWLITMGYTLELVPLIVKIGAISTMLQAAKKMRRVKIPRERLFGIVGGICLVTALYLTTWTLIDPPTRGRQLTLQLEDPDESINNSTTSTRAWWQAPTTPVNVSYYCRSSGSAVWYTISLAWQLFLLLCAAVLAIQTRRIQQRWNESRTLAIMVYTQTGVVVLRFLLWLLETPSGMSLHFVDLIGSLIFSLDALLALVIYFGSKLVEVYKFDHSIGIGTASRRSGDFGSRFSMDDGTGTTGRWNATNVDLTSGRVSLGGMIDPFRNTLTSSGVGLPIRTSLAAGDIIMPSTRRLPVAPMTIENPQNDLLRLCPRCKASNDARSTPVERRPALNGLHQRSVKSTTTIDSE